MANNQVTKICPDCGKEFQISKFQPYIVHCKVCRKGKPVQKSYQTKKKERKKEMRSHGFNCPACRQVLDAKKGLFVCPSCETHYWKIDDNWYRNFHTSKNGTYGVYFKGEYAGDMTGEPGSLKKVVEGFNAR